MYRNGNICRFFWLRSTHPHKIQFNNKNWFCFKLLTIFKRIFRVNRLLLKLEFLGWILDCKPNEKSVRRKRTSGHRRSDIRPLLISYDFFFWGDENVIVEQWILLKINISLHYNEKIKLIFFVLGCVCVCVCVEIKISAFKEKWIISTKSKENQSTTLTK